MGREQLNSAHAAAGHPHTCPHAADGIRLLLCGVFGIAEHSDLPDAGRCAPVHLQAGPAACPRNIRQVGVTVLPTAHDHSIEHLLLLLAACLSVITKLYTGHLPGWVAADAVTSACCTAAVVAAAVSCVLCCAEWSCGHDLCVVLYVLV